MTRDHLRLVRDARLADLQRGAVVVHADAVRGDRSDARDDDALALAHFKVSEFLGTHMPLVLPSKMVSPSFGPPMNCISTWATSLLPRK